MDKYNNIPDEKFTFAQMDERIHDVKFETKPIGYLADAWMRFRKNKASIVALWIIIFIVLYALIVPMVSDYTISDADGVYAKMRPKNEFLSSLSLFDGTYDQKLNDKYYMYMVGIGMATLDTDGQGGIGWSQALNAPMSPIASLGNAYYEDDKLYRDAAIDSYYAVGFKYLSITTAEYEDIQAWEKESGIQVLYPMVDINSKYCDSNNQTDANYWYRHAANGSPLNIKGKKMELDDAREQGLVDNYLRDSEGNVQFFMKKDKSMIMVRVLYYNYFQYKNGYEPLHTFGTDAQGYDIFVRLAHGLRLSLLLAISVSIINLTIGSIYGAVEGYYGGAADLIMERITEILDGIPFVVVATLFQLHLVIPGKVSPFAGILLAFVATGWISTAYRVRTQFYRFKNQEYVLVARTLGAKDARLMFKHIFPNALGTIITSSVLVIPGVVFTESTMSYLGIINFNTQNSISLGTLLSNGQGYLATDPHIILTPAIVISLLMISFNLFGNGLRDAFNPSLRGADE